MNLFFHLLVLFFTTRFLAAQPVAFIRNGKLVDAYAQAKESGKLVFVDIYADWCAPCKMMDQSVFSDPEVAGRMNAFFVNLKANTDVGGGHAIVRQFRVNTYPTLLFLDPSDGSTLVRLPGAVDKRAFLFLLNQVLLSSPDGELFLACENSWNSGQSTAEIVDAYFQLRTQYKLPNDSLIEDYLHRLPADSLDGPGR